jgi:hypothetical protein
LVRERLGVVCDPQRARAVAEEAIAGAALVKNHPPDLINVALAMLVKVRGGLCWWDLTCAKSPASGTSSGTIQNHSVIRPAMPHSLRRLSKPWDTKSQRPKL